MVKSAERVLDVLEFLKQSGPSSFTQITTALRLPRSSASMLLKSLVDKGYLALDPSSHLYRPTYRVALLGEGISSRAVMDNRFLNEALAKLHENTGMTVVVGMQNGAYVQYIHVMSQSASLMRRLPIGKLRPLAYNPLGKVLLAEMPDERVGLLVRHNNASRHSHLPKLSEAALLEEIAAIRAGGIALDAGFSWPDAIIAAQAIRPSAGLPILAVAVGGLKEVFEPHRDMILREFRSRMKSWELRPSEPDSAEPSDSPPEPGTAALHEAVASR